MPSLSEYRAQEVSAKEDRLKRDLATVRNAQLIQERQQAQAATARRDAAAQQNSASALAQQAFTRGQTQTAIGGQAQNLAYRDSTAGLATDALNNGRAYLASANAQQAQAMGQRNTAVNSSLANALAQSAPGHSTYDQGLQQMLTGSFAPNDPSYQWRLQQGTENLSRAGAAKGLLGSGNMAAELVNYGQNQASQEYQAQFQRLLGASQNAISQYATAYNALGGMLNQQTAQAAQGNANQQVAQGWEQTGQSWGQQARGWDSQAQGWDAQAQKWEGLTQGWDAQAQGWSGQGTNQGTLQTKFNQLALDQQQLDINQQQANNQTANAGTNAYSAYQQSKLANKAFDDKTNRLNNADAGAQASLADNSSLYQNAYGQNQTTTSTPAPAQQYDYYKGPIQNSYANTLPSGSGFITNSSVGKISFAGGQPLYNANPGPEPAYEPFTNEYNFSGIYGD